VRSGGLSELRAVYSEFDAISDRSVSFKVCYTLLEKTSWSLFWIGSEQIGRGAANGGVKTA
jgi:hypothetical protein